MALVLGYVEIELLVAAVVCLVIVFHHGRCNKNSVLTYWPVVGMLPELLRCLPRLHDRATEVLQESGGTFEFKGPWFGVDLDFVVTSDPVNVQHILNKNFANYPKGPECKEIFEPLGDGILNVDSDLWRLQRKMFHFWSGRHGKFDLFIARTIQRKVVDGLIPFLDHVSETRIQIDLQELIQKMIGLNNAILLIFGLDPASHTFKLSISEYQKAFEDMQEMAFHRHVVPQSVWKLQKWLQIGVEGKASKAVKIFDEFIYQCLSMKREQLFRSSRLSEKDREEVEVDLITVYMEDKENPYSHKFLRDVALNFVAAGRDTLNSGLTWFFWLVATHPSVEAKILEEMRDNLPEAQDDKCDFQNHLNKLVYLQAALFETFRLYPALPFSHKTAAEADTLPSGHHLKRRSRVIISLYSMGRMEEIWGKDCLEFRPERWIDLKSRGLLYVPSHKYAAFSTGPRTCLGKDMAFIQMKVVAIAILRNYSLRVVDGHPISPSSTISLHMKHGLKVRVSKRCA